MTRQIFMIVIAALAAGCNKSDSTAPNGKQATKPDLPAVQPVPKTEDTKAGEKTAKKGSHRDRGQDPSARAGGTARSYRQVFG